MRQIVGFLIRVHATLICITFIGNANAQDWDRLRGAISFVGSVQAIQAAEAEARRRNWLIAISLTLAVIFIIGVFAYLKKIEENTRKGGSSRTTLEIAFDMVGSFFKSLISNFKKIFGGTTDQTTSPDELGNPTPSRYGDSEFNGDKRLDNDAYVLFLTRKFRIDKNDVLNKYECNERLFETVDLALAYAAELDASEALARERKKEEQRVLAEERSRRLQEKQAEMVAKAEELYEKVSTKKDDIAANLTAKRKAILVKLKKIAPFLVVGVLIIVGGLIYKRSTDANQGIPPVLTDGWGMKQDVIVPGAIAELMLSERHKDKFRMTKFIYCPEDLDFQKDLGIEKACYGKQHGYSEKISDLVLPMREVYKQIAEYEEHTAYAQRNELRSKMMSEGWQYIRYYYVKACHGGADWALVNDYYNPQYPTEIRRLFICDDMVSSDKRWDAYEAEKMYVESGMFKGD